MGQVYQARDTKLDRGAMLYGPEGRVQGSTNRRTEAAMAMNVGAPLDCHFAAVAISIRGLRIVLIAMLSWFLSAAPSAQGHGEDGRNTRLVGTHALQARSAYQPLPVRSPHPVCRTPRRRNVQPAHERG